MNNMADTPVRQSIKTARTQLDAGDISSAELVDSCTSCIAKRDKSVHAYLEVFDDALVAENADGPLAGIPIAVKDNILIKDRHCSAASKMLESYTAAYDAYVVEKLRDAGAVLLGRTNMDEFAMGSSTEHSAFGATKNPLDEERVPGGSSGGSAAAVAYGGALAALGSDTGGSIRQPASFCGIVGLKPTYGAVSRFGLIAMGSSLDQIGPMTRTVDDAEIMFDAICGYDRRDSTSKKADAAGKIGKRLGVPRHFFTDGVDAEVLARFDETLQQLREQGYEIIDIELPSLSYALAAYYITMFAESSSNLTRFDGVRYGLHVAGDDLIGDYMKTRGEGFGAEVKRRIMLGTYVLSAGYYDAYYGTAGIARGRIIADFETAFASVDAVVTPTTPTTAFKLGEKEDPVSMYLADLFTVPANLTGLPALSVPCGLGSESNMPVGFQITAPRWHEKQLFAVGRDVEKAGVNT